MLSEFSVQNHVILEPLDGLFWQNGFSKLGPATAIGEPNSGTCYRRSYNGSFSNIMEGSCVGRSHRICKKKLILNHCFLDGFTIDPIIKIIEEVQDIDVFECLHQCQEVNNCAVATYRKGNKLCQLHEHGL